MLVLKNVKVLTLDDKNSIANAVLIDRNTIMAVGEITDFENLPGNTQFVDLAGCTVLPGFTDSHIHLLQYAKFLMHINCDTPSGKDFLEEIKKASQRLSPGSWIQGYGWSAAQWKDAEISKDILDAITNQHPICLVNKSFHGAWVNSKALKVCGVDASTNDPVGGRIGREPDGTPNGLLFESAMGLVTDKIPQISDIEAIELLQNAQPLLFKRGITTVHDFDRLTSFRALQYLEQTGELKLRVIKTLPIDSMDDIIAIGLQSGFGSPHLTFRGIKLFMDGALGTKTAAMLAPYENTNETGMLLIQQDELTEIAQKASRHHLQLAIHAIGDLANRIVIETFQNLRNWEHANQINGLTHRIEHLQTCSLMDITNLAGLNVVASVQPIHIASDIPAADKWLGERVKGTYAFNSLRNSGIPLVFGSDAPVEEPDCLLGIHTAIRRTQRNDLPIEGWQPQERLSVVEALKGFTRTPHLLFPLSNAQLGQIRPGYKADLIVTDSFSLDDTDQSFKDLKIHKTMIDGQWVWDDDHGTH